MDEIKLPTKTAELKLRRFLRQLTGAPQYCKIYSKEYQYQKIKEFQFPQFSGEKSGFIVHSYPKWYTINGRKTKTKGSFIYKRSTEKVEIGIKHLNVIKSLWSKKSKYNYKLSIDNKLINLPNIWVGRYIVKHYPDKSKKLKIIK